MLEPGVFLQELGASLGCSVSSPLSSWFALFSKIVPAAMGATYGFTKSAAANLRERDDSWNPAIAGFLAGSIGGLRSKFEKTMESDLRIISA